MKIMIDLKDMHIDYSTFKELLNDISCDYENGFLNLNIWFQDGQFALTHDNVTNMLDIRTFEYLLDKALDIVLLHDGESENVLPDTQRVYAFNDIRSALGNFLISNNIADTPNEIYELLDDFFEFLNIAENRTQKDLSLREYIESICIESKRTKM
jgi:hypothetical protein